MATDHKALKTALDETRLLILGAEILFGFHLRAAFQDEFDRLPSLSRILFAFAFFSMAVVIGLLIAPSLQHRIVENGRSSGRILVATTWFAGLALLPFAVSLGTDVAIMVGFQFGTTVGASLGIVLAIMALVFWYGIEWLLRRSNGKRRVMTEESAPIDVRVEHMLTEARVLLPGAQALFGFQLAVFLTDGFGKLPGVSQVLHTSSLCCIAVSVILLMAPAAFHRITFNGQNSERFHRLGSGFVIASAVPLAAGIAGDIYVAVAKATDQTIGAAAALAIAAILAGLWFIHPLVLRSQRRKKRTG